ncbi:MAG: YkvA family protein, partial [Candidatus Kariarchaeaceae archaeon]
TLVVVELFKHPEIPRIARILIFGLLTYILSPIDLIPDFMPLFGHWDDILVIIIVIGLVKRTTSHELIDKVRADIAANPDIKLLTPKRITILVILLVLSLSLTWIAIRALGFDSHIGF